MWFIFLGIGLTLLLVGGLYTRRRFLNALQHLGVSPRALAVARWLTLWLLYFFPLLVIAVRVSGLRFSIDLDGPVATWLLSYPFFLSLLVMVQALPFLLAIDLARIAIYLARRRTERTARFFSMGVVLVIAGFLLYTPARVLAEHGALRVRHFAVSPSIAAAEDRISDAGAAPRPPFRIAFVADLQQDRHTGEEEAARVVELINAESPDLVLSGGDWINHGPDYIEAAAVTAGALTGRLGTYSVRGDHEHFAGKDRFRSAEALERALAAHNVTMLANQVRWFSHQGKRIGVVFLNYNYIFRSDDQTIRQLVQQVAGADYAILLTHQFDERVAALVKDKVDLVLAAHTHGGQVNPVLGFFHFSLARVETRFVDGRYTLGKTTVITTSGVGYSLVPLRYASPGSLEIIDVKL